MKREPRFENNADYSENESFEQIDTNKQDLLRPRRRWFWLKIVVAFIAGIFFVNSIINSYRPISLRVQLNRMGTVEVTNTGSKPVTIKTVLINDRKDCVAGGGIIVGPGEFRSQTLKVGDITFVNSMCNIVHVAFDTDLGSVSYSFSR